MRVAIIGGGITGLAAAWQLRSSAEVTVFEPGHLGGKLVTTEFLGRPVDCGPDAFLTRTPAALHLATELGLEDDLVAPTSGQVLLWWRGRLRRLPSETVLGIPTALGPTRRSGLLSLPGVARAALDLVLPANHWPEDLSVYELVNRRLGHQVASRLVGPLVGSIHAGTIERLSAAATMPQVLAAARDSRSLMRGLRGGPAGGAGGGGGRLPVFLAPRGGMQVLAERLVAALSQQGVSFVCEAATAVLARSGRSVVVEPAGAAFDAAVLALPAGLAAKLLGAGAPGGLSAIRSASVVLTTLAYDSSELEGPPGASGILVPDREHRLMTACSFGNTKWPHWADQATTVLRVSAGRFGDDRAVELEEEDLVGRLDSEIRAALGRSARGGPRPSRGAAPLAWRVNRWPSSFPQYEVGHLALVESIEADLARHCPQVAVAGASYRGAGIPACVASGTSAAARLIQRVGRVRQAGG